MQEEENEGKIKTDWLMVRKSVKINRKRNKKDVMA